MIYDVLNDILFFNAENQRVYINIHWINMCFVDRSFRQWQKLNISKKGAFHRKAGFFDNSSITIHISLSHLLIVSILFINN